VASDFDSLDDGALEDYLTTVARERGEHLVVEERGDGWVAELLDGEVIRKRVTEADRRTALRRLVDLLARDPG